MRFHPSPSSVFPASFCPALKSSWYLRLPRGDGRISPAGSRLLAAQKNGAANWLNPGVPLGQLLRSGTVGRKSGSAWACGC